MRHLICALLGALLVSFSYDAHAQLSGTVTYTGTDSGTIRVEAFTEDAATFEKLTESMVNPGPFEFTTVADGAYTVVAFIDANDDGRLDGDEVWIDAGSSITVPPGSASIALDLDAYVVPGSADEAGDDGCCATIDGRTASPYGALFLLFAALIRRRR